MSDTNRNQAANPPVLQPRPSLVRLTHVIYGLHACAVVIGLVGASTIAGAFVFGVPSLLAVVLNYFKRHDVRGTWLEDHFSWQIRTFWFTALWLVVYFLMVLTVLLIPVALILIGLLGLWVLYRVVRGWLALDDGRPVKPYRS